MIDEVELWRLINRCVHLKYKFAGVYTADNFPLNNDIANQKGTHWSYLGYLFITTSTFATGYHLKISE